MEWRTVSETPNSATPVVHIMCHTHCDAVCISAKHSKHPLIAHSLTALQTAAFAPLRAAYPKVPRSKMSWSLRSSHPTKGTAWQPWSLHGHGVLVFVFIFVFTVALFCLVSRCSVEAFLAGVLEWQLFRSRASVSR